MKDGITRTLEYGDTIRWKCPLYGISKKVESWRNNMDENEPIERDGIWERKESNDTWVREDGKFEKNRYVKNMRKNSIS